MKDGGTKQIVLNLGKQHTDKQGWEAELAPRWRGGALEVRRPARIAGREELQVVAQVTSSSYEKRVACQW